MVRSSSWWWWIVVVAALGEEEEKKNEGYLFVSNRPDEVVSAARQIRRVSPRANITFISDSASLSDVAEELDALFDVVIKSEEAMPDIGRTESMGFRLQKLRGMGLSPYARTVYMDSDTHSCRPVDELFELLRLVDVACVHGGRGNHSGASAGVLAYAKTPASTKLWKAWENEYRTVMATSRREQPSFQRAMASVRNVLKVHKLPLSYNCRNVRDCEPALLKDGTIARCSIIHAHDFAFTTRSHNNVSMKKDDVLNNKCPSLSGGHRLVMLLSPPSALEKNRFVLDDALLQSLQALTLDNDFSVCDLRKQSSLNFLRPCLEKSNRYSTVALGSFRPDELPDDAVAIALARHPLARLRDVLSDVDLPALETCVAEAREESSWSCFERGARLENKNVDTAWFSSGSLDFEDAAQTIQSRFLAVGLTDALIESAREFERALPSHFLRLSSKIHAPHDGGAVKLSTRVKEAFLSANHLDLQLYELIRRRLRERRRDCVDRGEEEDGPPRVGGDQRRSSHHHGHPHSGHHRLNRHHHHLQRSDQS